MNPLRERKSEGKGRVWDAARGKLLGSWGDWIGFYTFAGNSTSTRKLSGKQGGKHRRGMVVSFEKTFR